MAKVSRSKTKPRSFELSDNMKKILFGSLAGVVLIGSGWWGYLTFTNVAPPVLVEAAPPERAEEVAAYLGNERGFGRMSVDQQEQYLIRAYQTFGGQQEARTRFIQSLEQMSSAERQVLNTAVFEISRKHVMKHAEEYAKTPPGMRGQYIEKAAQQFEQMRSQIIGGGSSNSLSEPLKGGLPTKSDEMLALVYNKTEPGERAKAMPFIDAMAARYKEQKAQRK